MSLVAVRLKFFKCGNVDARISGNVHLQSTTFGGYIIHVTFKYICLQCSTFDGRIIHVTFKYICLQCTTSDCCIIHVTFKYLCQVGKSRLSVCNV